MYTNHIGAFVVADGINPFSLDSAVAFPGTDSNIMTVTSTHLWNSLTNNKPLKFLQRGKKFSCTKVLAILLESSIIFYIVWIHTCALHVFLHSLIIYYIVLNYDPMTSCKYWIRGVSLIFWDLKGLIFKEYLELQDISRLQR